MGRVELLLLVSAIALTGRAAGQQRPAVGVEFQRYPAGWTGSGRIDVAIALGLTGSGYLGYNLARRGDFGKHDDERGGGPGAGLGLRRWFGGQPSGLFVGARVDLWWLAIDWDDRTPSARRGTTDITVFQPTARAGYGVVLGPSVLLELSAAAGAEVNVRTRGEAVGEGAIALVGAALVWRF